MVIILFFSSLLDVEYILHMALEGYPAKIRWDIGTTQTSKIQRGTTIF